MPSSHPPSTSFTVGQFFERAKERLKLRLLAGADGLPRPIIETAVNRPGLALAGFYRHFPVHRIQVVGLAEYDYLAELGASERMARLERLFATRVPAILFTRGMKPSPEVIQLADRHNVPLLVTSMVTRNFVNVATLVLEDLAAPRCRVHATMMEVVGLGVMLEGPAGIGKSETALGLIHHGHALVADDLTELKRDKDDRLIASAVPVTRYYMEIRGLGIIYVPAIFGVSAIRGEKHVDLVVTLRMVKDEAIDRSGADDLHREFLGVSVPQVILPVAPGRDLVNIVETVAAEYKLRFSGQVAHQDLDAQIIRHHLATTPAKKAHP
ncbi:MAG: HPr(Ser) kinase/phosphatase [Kiritimatiellia bacterium]|jgi:HPr kinase/phosphorylase